MDTHLLTQKLIEQEFWKEPTFSLQDLFRIRDCLTILKDYGLCDEGLLREVRKFINQKVGNNYVL